MSERREAPNNLEAERSVLGGIIIDNARFDDAAAVLVDKDFFRDAHRRIWRGLVALSTQQKPLDLVHLKEELDNEQDDLEECGGPAYLASLVDGVPRSTNVKHYAQIVKEKATARGLIKIGQWLVDAAYSGEQTPHALTNQVDLKLTTLATEAKFQTGAVSVGASLSALNSDLDARIARQGQISGWSTGFPTLDLFTHGWQAQQMIVLAGQTSFGKSVLAMQVALAIARAGGRVVYYSYEMPGLDLQYRMLSALSEVPLSAIMWGNIRTESQWAALRDAQELMATLPLEINDGSSRSIVDVRAECRQIKADRGLAAVVIDHFQLTESDDGENRVQQLASNSRRIQALGPELDIVTFAVSQLTLSDRDATREPQLDDLRECKSLGHEANLCAFLHPYKMSEARTDTPVVPMKLLIRKNRGGPPGVVTLNLERDYTRFVEAEPPAKEPAAPKEPKGRKMPLKW